MDTSADFASSQKNRNPWRSSHGHQCPAQSPDQDLGERQHTTHTSVRYKQHCARTGNVVAYVVTLRVNPAGWLPGTSQTAGWRTQPLVLAPALAPVLELQRCEHGRGS